MPITDGGKDLQNRKVLSLEWKSEGVMDDDDDENPCHCSLS